MCVHNMLDTFTLLTYTLLICLRNVLMNAYDLLIITSHAIILEISQIGSVWGFTVLLVVSANISSMFTHLPQGGKKQFPSDLSKHAK
jgi:hypothetical protein